jgi:hypothetical protein
VFSASVRINAKKRPVLASKRLKKSPDAMMEGET